MTAVSEAVRIREPEAVTGLQFSALGLMELDALAQRVTDYVRSDLGIDLVNMTILDKRDLVVRATAGNRTEEMVGMRFPVRTGLGGLALSQRRPVNVDEYAQVQSPLPFRDVMVRREGIRAAAGFPLFVHSEALGLLFVGRRGEKTISPDDAMRLNDIAATVSPMVGASMQMAQAVEAARADERQRLVREVHDELIPLLFGIGVNARRAREIAALDDRLLHEQLRSIESLAGAANSMARDALDAADAVPDGRDLALRLRTVTRRFSGRAATPVSFGVAGTPFLLDQAASDTLGSVVTEALNNVMKHAPDSGVAVTLTFGADMVTVAVMDDGGGHGEPNLSQLTTSSAGRVKFGLKSLRHRMSLLGGRLQVSSNEDGGLTVRAWVPALP